MFDMNNSTNKILTKLKNDLNKYDKIILLSDDLDFMLNNLILSDKKNVLYLVSKKNNYNKKCENVRYVSKSTINFLVDLYYTYNFSDRFKVISNSINFASLLNYLFLGILTEDEVLEIILM